MRCLADDPLPDLTYLLTFGIEWRPTSYRGVVSDPRRERDDGVVRGGWPAGLRWPDGRICCRLSACCRRRSLGT